VDNTLLSFTEALTRKAYELNERGEYSAAVKLFQRVIQIEPDSISAWFGKGVAHLRMKEYRKSIHCYQQVHKQDPQSAGAWNNSAICYLELGYKKAAIDRYKKAIQFQIEQKISRSNAFENLISTFEDLGRFPEALGVADLWIKSFPESQEARETRNTLMNLKQVSNVVRLNIPPVQPLTQEQIKIFIHRIYIRLGRPPLKPGDSSPKMSEAELAQRVAVLREQAEWLNSQKIEL
jgi:tetratricopeptide (TPR) repeat protein